LFENIAVFDIGTSSVKMLTARTGLRDFQVTSYAIEEIDQNAENKQDEIDRALATILSENELKGYTVVTVFQTDKLITRNISLPFKNPDQIAGVLPFEAEDLMPFPLEDMVIDFQLIPALSGDDTKILFAAARKDSIRTLLESLSRHNLHPVKMSIEPNSLFECYKYFSTIQDESIIQLDIGHSKSLLTIAESDSLLFCRNISYGMRDVYNEIADHLKLELIEIKQLFEHNPIDMTSYENNIHRDVHESLGISKSKFKKIYNMINDHMTYLVEQVLLSVKAFTADYGDRNFSRIFISGGGSRITGIGTILSNEMDLPVVAQPFMKEINEYVVQTQFPVAFGTLIDYLNTKKKTVNLLKDEFETSTAGLSRKMYYLAASFIILTLIVILINIVSSLILRSQSEEYYNQLLTKRFQRYFHVQKEIRDPVKEATRLYKDMKKEVDNLESFLKTDVKVLETLKTILQYFPSESSFELNNMVINENIIRIDGVIGSGLKIDQFKNKLNDSNLFESVVLNTNIKKGNNVRFAMTIKMKTNVPGAEDNEVQ